MTIPTVFPTPEQVAQLRANNVRPQVDALRERILLKMRTTTPNDKLGGEYYLDHDAGLPEDVLALLRKELLASGWMIRRESAPAPRSESFLVIYPHPTGPHPGPASGT
jgi:ABC-type uncharacterized transport system, permease component